MSTIVVVKKGDQVCIAADSLTSFGDLRFSSDYDADHDKIIKKQDAHIGIVGSAAHQMVMESILADKKVKADFSSKLAIFETFRSLHPILKEKYFLNAKDEDDDPYESTQIDALIASKYGIFGVHSLREISEYTRFWSIGSGSEYALGAMYAVYEKLESAEEIAAMGVMAGAEFNTSSSMPMSSYVIELENKVV